MSDSEIKEGNLLHFVLTNRGSEVPAQTSEQKSTKTFAAIIKADPAYHEGNLILQLAFHFLTNIEVSNIVLWRDPVKTGLLFGIFNFFFLLVCWGDYTVVTLESYLLLSLLAVCVGYVNFFVLKATIGGKHGEHPFK
jgi:hypothetical protein